VDFFWTTDYRQDTLEAAESLAWRFQGGRLSRESKKDKRFGCDRYCGNGG